MLGAKGLKASTEKRYFKCQLHESKVGKRIYDFIHGRKWILRTRNDRRFQSLQKKKELKLLTSQNASWIMDTMLLLFPFLFQEL